MKIKFFILLLLIFFFGLARLDRLFFKQNASFCLYYIQPKWSVCPKLVTKKHMGIETIVDQPFTYLTKGKQSFVFVSQDQKWVLKLPRLPRYARNWYVRGKKSSIADLQKMFDNFKSAYEELEGQTGVVYAHLQPTKFLNQKISFKRFPNC